MSELGDLSELAPLEPEVSWGEGISTEKSRFGRGNCLAMVALAEVVMVAVAECGESPLEDGDMLSGALHPEFRPRSGAQAACCDGNALCSSQKQEKPNFYPEERRRRR